MNSKILLFTFLVIISSCGVKAPPLKYPETIVDSYTAQYTGGELSPEEVERMKNTNVIPSNLDPKKNTADPNATTTPNP